MSEQKYYDFEGREITLYKLVRTEPLWAESRIKHMTAEITTQSGVISAQAKQIEDLKATLDAVEMLEIYTDDKRFANFWACFVDPLNARIDEMQATIKRQQAALDVVYREKDRLMTTGFVAEKRCLDALCGAMDDAMVKAGDKDDE